MNLVVILKAFVDLSKAFGQGIGFGLGLWLLPFVFYPLLGYGDYEYVGDGGSRSGTARRAEYA